MANNQNPTEAGWSAEVTNKHIPMDAILKDGNIIFTLLVPGVDISDLNLEADGNTIELSGIFRKPYDGENYLLSEITESNHWGEFHKQFETADPFDRDSISASLEKGILKIVVPLLVTKEREKIAIAQK
jgi:HSP20 family molecular chaperone IbpA